MRANLPLLLGTAVLLCLTGVLAGPRDYLFRGEYLCDAEKVFCFRGTLSYQSNPRVLQLRARVQTAPGPGLLRIWLAAADRQGHRHVFPFEVRVRGQYSEIINHKMIPDHPNAQGWEVQLVEFIAD